MDKPSGCTSHDVVGRLRYVLRTRRIGHAGTLDPMATGLLVLAVDRSTKLLGHLALTDKTYLATIRLGQQTDTDDADGLVVATAGPVAVDAVSDDDIRAGVAALTGPLLQVPSSVSAIKVDGRRAYDLVRSGETVELAARPVTVVPVRDSRCAAPGHGDGDGAGGVIDLDVAVDCTTGTYIRSLARDLGAALGVGGHLTKLRRTRVGPFDIAARSTSSAQPIRSRQPVDATVPRPGQHRCVPGCPINRDGGVRRRDCPLDHPGRRCGPARLSGPHRRRGAGARRCGTDAPSTPPVSPAPTAPSTPRGAGRVGRRTGRRGAVGAGLADRRLRRVRPARMPAVPNRLPAVAV